MWLHVRKYAFAQDDQGIWSKHYKIMVENVPIRIHTPTIMNNAKLSMADYKGLF